MVFRRSIPDQSRSASPSVAVAILKQTNPLNISQTTRELPSNLINSISHLHSQSGSASAAFSSLSPKPRPKKVNMRRDSPLLSSSRSPSPSENVKNAANDAIVHSEVDATYHVLFSTRVHRTKFIQALTSISGIVLMFVFNFKLCAQSHPKIFHAHFESLLCSTVSLKAFVWYINANQRLQSDSTSWKLREKKRVELWQAPKRLCCSPVWRNFEVRWFSIFPFFIGCVFLAFWETQLFVASWNCV